MPWGAIHVNSGSATCSYCGLIIVVSWSPTGEPQFIGYDGTAVHLDHVIPETRNGPTSLDNTVLACAPCNLAKRDLALGDPRFQERLRQRRSEVDWACMPHPVRLAWEHFDDEITEGAL